jgi:hypothetical protein
VGDVALSYRDKETPLKPTHYACSTGLAIAHVQSVVIHRVIMELEHVGRTDLRLQAWGSMEERLHVLLGLDYSAEQAKDCEIGTSRGYFPGACMAHSGGTDVGVGCSRVWQEALPRASGGG